MRKVLICVPDLGICNGVTTFIMSFYEQLLQQEYKIDFLVVMHQHMEMESYVLERGSKVFKVPLGMKYDKKRVRYIDDVLRNGMYDIVHVNFLGPNGAMILKMAKKYGVEHRIYHCHNPINKLSLKAVLSETIFTYVCRKRANKYLACSTSAGKAIFKNDKFEVVNNAINPDDFSYNRNARIKIREDLKIGNRLAVGVAARMDAQKNPGFIIEVFSELKKLREDAVLIWIGDGAEKVQIENLCKKKDIEEAVFLVGRQSNMDEWYSAMDLFLLPSKFEGLGIVYLEAQANGLLCFGSDRVPKETEVTGLMHRISLEKGADKWAIEMLKAYEEQDDKHTVDFELFKKSGYDIKYVRNRLWDVYESCYNE